MGKSVKDKKIRRCLVSIVEKCLGVSLCSGTCRRRCPISRQIELCFVVGIVQYVFQGGNKLYEGCYFSRLGRDESWGLSRCLMESSTHPTNCQAIFLNGTGVLGNYFTNIEKHILRSVATSGNLEVKLKTELQTELQIELQMTAEAS